MTISLENVSKRFNREWIFRNVNFKVSENTSTAIIGPNGSGKSTLLQIIAGSLLATDGKIIYQSRGGVISDDEIYRHISMTAPYLDIIEDFTLEEFLSFHFKFKKLNPEASLEELPKKMQLEHAAKKEIKNFSTGMRQRVKLGISFFSDSPVILLDEPATNLDKNGLDWYHQQIDHIQKDRIIFVSSNSKEEYSFCPEKIDILDFK